MPFPCRNLHAVWLISLLLLRSGSMVRADEMPSVDFSRDVRPLLSQYCYACHGPDEASRQAGLRLDRADVATSELESGHTAIFPGRPESSELLARISSTDPDLQMPPASTGHTLSADQQNVLRKWIESGAKFDDHWSFRPIIAQQPPTVDPDDWIRNPIDAFVLAKLQRERVMPSPEADRSTLLRRLSLDLLGLPPQPSEVTEFLSDDSPDAYERLVDRLLASPHFGERWGRHWLDVAHYADSDGYLGDTFRDYAWLYRDWVIDAVNRDLPFDQFTIQQLAGDLLPDATVKEKTATGFLRNTMRNTEAGVDLEEYRLKEVVDRVSTVGVGWLGLSLGCAECHSHKFDPISQREFYQLFAFFNDADDIDIDAPLPGELETYQSRLAAWTTNQSRLQTELTEKFPSDNDALRIALDVDAKKRSVEQKTLIESLLKNTDEAARQLASDYERHVGQKPTPPATRAMTVARREAPRTSWIHVRGDYRNRGEDVHPGTPSVLPPLVAGESPDRLDLARWLVDPQNPLTPRVTVNHVWKHLFGRGLVATVDNFGSGGEAPSHPELLDWLATEFMNRGWSRKALIRLIVTSSTYRQSSAVREELISRDPLNVWLARQSRFRLEAENVRDAALAASGLLNRRIGGPGIRPPQPDYVASISRNTEWKVSTGPDLYRRGMYIVFRRATPYPMLLTFDAPDSTVACTFRERSNSPLQALTLLNDPVFVECAAALGKSLHNSPHSTFDERLAEGFLRTVGRGPQPPEVLRLNRFFQDRCQQFSADIQAARELAGEVSEARMAERAAWIATARVLMNLDEFINRE
jgi:hypothetical protein